MSWSIFMFFIFGIFLILKQQQKNNNRVLIYALVVSLNALKAEKSRGSIWLMKLSEACSTRADGRACQAANSKSTAVISQAWWETTLRSECWGPTQLRDQRAGPLIHQQLERCCCHLKDELKTVCIGFVFKVNLEKKNRQLCKILCLHSYNE